METDTNAVFPITLRLVLFYFIPLEPQNGTKKKYPYQHCCYQLIKNSDISFVSFLTYTARERFYVKALQQYLS